MYFITTKRMLEVCFSAHPNIQYRTFFPYFTRNLCYPVQWDNPYPQIINKDIHKLSTLSTIGYPGLSHDLPSVIFITVLFHFPPAH